MASQELFLILQYLKVDHARPPALGAAKADAVESRRPAYRARARDLYNTASVGRLRTAEQECRDVDAGRRLHGVVDPLVGPEASGAHLRRHAGLKAVGRGGSVDRGRDTGTGVVRLCLGAQA